MNNTQFFRDLKCSRPDAYKTLVTLARSMRCYSGTYMRERRESILHTYCTMKIALLAQNMYSGNFLCARYIGIHDRTKSSWTFRWMSEREKRGWEKSKRIGSRK